MLNSYTKTRNSLNPGAPGNPEPFYLHQLVKDLRTTLKVVPALNAFLFPVPYPGSAFRFMADWPDDEVAAFVAAARNGADETLMVLPPQKVLF